MSWQYAALYAVDFATSPPFVVASTLWFLGLCAALGVRRFGRPRTLGAGDRVLPTKLRTGRKIGRTVYAQLGQRPDDDDPVIGMLDWPELAAEVARRWNAAP